MSFIPDQNAASALIELRNSPSLFVHLVHPHPVKWNDIIGYLSDALQIPSISHEEWLTRLEEASLQQLAEGHPARQLLDFYRTAFLSKQSDAAKREAMGLPLYDTTNAVADCSSLFLDNLPRFRSEEVTRWVEYWRRQNVL